MYHVVEAAVYGIGFHPDGSLLASADLNGRSYG